MRLDGGGVKIRSRGPRELAGGRGPQTHVAHTELSGCLGATCRGALRGGVPVRGTARARQGKVTTGDEVGELERPTRFPVGRITLRRN